MHIFTDGSVNCLVNKSIGCYLILDNLNSQIDSNKIVSIEYNINSSTMVELLTIQHILNLIDIKFKNKKFPKIYLYTDCMNFINILTIRKNKENFKKHKNYIFYKELILLIQKFNIKVIWIKGHDKKINKIEEYQKIFSIVDKHVRKLSRKLSL